MQNKPHFCQKDHETKIQFEWDTLQELWIANVNQKHRAVLNKKCHAFYTLCTKQGKKNESLSKQTLRFIANRSPKLPPTHKHRKKPYLYQELTNHVLQNPFHGYLPHYNESLIATCQAQKDIEGILITFVSHALAAAACPETFHRATLDACNVLITPYFQQPAIKSTIQTPEWLKLQDRSHWTNTQVWSGPVKISIAVGLYPDHCTHALIYALQQAPFSGLSLPTAPINFMNIDRSTCKIQLESRYFYLNRTRMKNYVLSHNTQALFSEQTLDAYAKLLKYFETYGVQNLSHPTLHTWISQTAVYLLKEPSPKSPLAALPARHIPSTITRIGLALMWATLIIPLIIAIISLFTRKNLFRAMYAHFADQRLFNRLKKCSLASPYTQEPPTASQALASSVAPLINSHSPQATWPPPSNETMQSPLLASSPKRASQ